MKKLFTFIGALLFSITLKAAVYGPDIHSQPTLQSGTTAYPQFLYVGSTASIPTLTSQFLYIGSSATIPTVAISSLAVLSSVTVSQQLNLTGTSRLTLPKGCFAYDGNTVSFRLNCLNADMFSIDINGINLSTHSVVTGTMSFTANSQLVVGATTRFTQASSTITALQVISTATLQGDVPRYGQVKSLQFVQNTVTTASSTALTAYITTNLSASITPSNTASKVKISANSNIFTGHLSSTTCSATIARNGTNLGSAIGLSFLNGSQLTQDLQVPLHMDFLDSPATTSSVTYAVQIKSSDGLTSCGVQANGNTGVIILEEVNGL